jgi:hypothetical protein
MMLGQAVNKVVIWDKIVLNRTAAVINLVDELAEYPVADQFMELRLV